MKKLSLILVLVFASQSLAALKDCPLLPRNWPGRQPPTVIVNPPQPNTIYFFPRYYYPGQQYYYYYYPQPNPCPGGVCPPATPQINIQPGSVQVNPISGPSFSSVQTQMNAESNRYRARFGKGPCQANPILMKTAQEHAERMARYNRMSHNLGGSPGSRASANGWRGGASENIAMGSSSVESTFTMWYRSGGHRRNMLGSSWNVAGFGHAVSRSGRHYWAAMYARN